MLDVQDLTFFSFQRDIEYLLFFIGNGEEEGNTKMKVREGSVGFCISFSVHSSFCQKWTFAVMKSECDIIYGVS